ncbi:MAG: hypothetical protein NW237_13860 [Cyanobacteriota bacterium]|nr:hypothetical protein [Cyanobacteriota bacterium]
MSEFTSAGIPPALKKGHSEATPTSASPPTRPSPLPKDSAALADQMLNGLFEDLEATLNTQSADDFYDYPYLGSRPPLRRQSSPIMGWLVGGATASMVIAGIALWMSGQAPSTSSAQVPLPLPTLTFSTQLGDPLDDQPHLDSGATPSPEQEKVTTQENAPSAGPLQNAPSPPTAASTPPQGSPIARPPQSPPKAAPAASKPKPMPAAPIASSPVVASLPQAPPGGWVEFSSPRAQSKTVPPPSVPQMKLVGLIGDPGAPKALILVDNVVRQVPVGYPIKGNWQVVSIAPQGVAISNGSYSHLLQLGIAQAYQ